MTVYFIAPDGHDEPTLWGYARPVPAPVIDAAHLARQREWSERTFGPQSPLGVLDHIRKELREIEDDPTDGTEWIDVVILALDGAWRVGWEPQQIIDAIKAKQARNEAREWPDWRTASLDRAIEHVRPAPAPERPADRDALAVQVTDLTDRLAVSRHQGKITERYAAQTDRLMAAIADAIEGLSRAKSRSPLVRGVLDRLLAARTTDARLMWEDRRREAELERLGHLDARTALAARPAPVCDTCQGVEEVLGMVPGFTGQPVEGVVPCPDCVARRPRNNGAAPRPAPDSVPAEKVRALRDEWRTLARIIRMTPSARDQAEQVDRCADGLDALLAEGGEGQSDG